MKSAAAEAEDRAGQQPSERITVALVPKAAGDLHEAVQRSGLSKTDIVNRAITLYQFIEDRLTQGDEILIRDSAGQLERIRFF